MYVVHVTDGRRSDTDILVGPFVTAEEAQAFTEHLARTGEQFSDALLRSGERDLAGPVQSKIRELLDHIPGFLPTP